MTAAVQEGNTGLSSILARAGYRRFCGLVLDGVDVKALLAAEADPAVLQQAFDLARRANEKIWAERFARRICEVDRGPASRLRLASYLASLGQCREAGSLLDDLPAGIDDELHRQVLGVLAAKAGRIEEAFAIFDALPGQAPGYHPASVVLSTAEEMVEQCDVAHTVAVAERLAESYPAHLVIRSLNLRGNLLAGRFDKARALARLPDHVIDQAPSYDRHAFTAAVAESLSLFGWMEQLFDFARARIEKEPTHWSLYDRAAVAARATAREKEYAALIEAIPLATRNSVQAMAVLCRWRADEAQSEEAKLLLEKIKPLSATLFLEASLYLSLYNNDYERIETELKSCEACGISLLGPTLAYGMHAYYYNYSTDQARKCLAKLETFLNTASNNVNFWQTYLRYLVALGEAQKAEDLYRKLPAGSAHSAALQPFQMFFEAGHGRDEDARKGWTKFIRATRHRCVNAPSSYPATVALKYTESSGAVLLFVTLVDAMDYLDWFLAHYRALGVDHFFVTDNGSSDGTLERLSAENDVSVFSNRESFARSGFGILWVNHLMQRFGVGHWCFHVDSDEAFVFPGYGGGRTLAELLAYCDERGYGCVPAIELDMYPERLDLQPGADPFESSCYFDINYVTVPSELPPYFMVQGGIRERLTGLALSMHKSPLVRIAPDVRYVECNHATTHLPVADVSAALLHYKFVANTRSRIGQVIARGEHFAGAITYRRLNSALSSMGSEPSLLSSDSRRYEGADALIRYGLIRSSPRWETYSGNTRREKR